MLSFGIIIEILYLSFIIIGVPLLVGSQNGNIFFKVYCNSVKYVNYVDLYHSVSKEDKENKYLFIIIQSCSFEIIFSFFCIGVIEVIYFYLIVLNELFTKSGSEFGIGNRIYDVITYIVDKNEDKICVDEIKIECKNNIYKRKLVAKDTQTIQNVGNFQNSSFISSRSIQNNES